MVEDIQRQSSQASSDANNRLRKQNYLIEKIMTPGYDTNEFSDFMIAQKEGGLDVDNYTYDEILNVSLQDSDFVRFSLPNHFFSLHFSLSTRLPTSQSKSRSTASL